MNSAGVSTKKIPRTFGALPSSGTGYASRQQVSHDAGCGRLNRELALRGIQRFSSLPSPEIHDDQPSREVTVSWGRVGQYEPMRSGANRASEVRQGAMKPVSPAGILFGFTWS